MLSTKHPEASHTKPHVSKIVGGVLGAVASTVVCGLLLSFRNNRRAICGLATYIWDAAKGWYSVYRRARRHTRASSASPPTASLHLPSSSTTGSDALPLPDDCNVRRSGGLQTADERAEQSEVVSLAQEGEVSTTGATVMSAERLSADEDDPYLDRQWAVLEAQLAGLRNVDAGPPPAYHT